MGTTNGSEGKTVQGSRESRSHPEVGIGMERLVQGGTGGLRRRPGGSSAASGRLGTQGADVDCRDLLELADEAGPLAAHPAGTLLLDCRDDPARFNSEVLGRTLWSRQVEVCQAVAHSQT